MQEQEKMKASRKSNWIAKVPYRLNPAPLTPTPPTTASPPPPTFSSLGNFKVEISFQQIKIVNIYAVSKLFFQTSKCINFFTTFSSTIEFDFF